MNENEGSNKQINLNININTRVVFFVIIIVVVCVAFYFLVFAPQFNKIKDLNTQIDEAEQHLNLLLVAQDRYDDMQKDVENYNRRIVDLKNLLPSERDEFLFNEEFSVLAKRTGGEIVSLSFSANATGDKKSVEKSVPFTLSYTANTLTQVNQYLQMLKDNFPQILTIVHVNIAKNNATDKTTSQSYNLTVQGLINLH